MYALCAYENARAAVCDLARDHGTIYNVSCCCWDLMFFFRVLAMINVLILVLYFFIRFYLWPPVPPIFSSGNFSRTNCKIPK